MRTRIIKAYVGRGECSENIMGSKGLNVRNTPKYIDEAKYIGRRRGEMSSGENGSISGTKPP